MSSKAIKYKFTERSLEGTFIRCWDIAKNKWVNRNLKVASDREFDRWIRKLFDHHSLLLDELNVWVWSIEERLKICRWLFEQELLVTLVDYLDT